MFRPILLIFASLIVLQSPLHGAPPAAALVPGITKLHITVADFNKLEKSWRKTKVAEMFDDPKLKPFFDDIFKESTLAKLGIQWSDLLAVSKGELSFSVFQPAPDQVAQVFTLFTGDEKAALQKLLAKAGVSLQKHGFKMATKNVAGQMITTFTRLATDKRDRDKRILSFTKDSLLVVSDNEKAMAEVLQRWQGTSPDRLDQKKGYQEVLARTAPGPRCPASSFGSPNR